MDINGTILDMEGRETYYVGGTNAWKTATYRGYNVSLEWFAGRRSTEPMLAIWPDSAGRDAGVWGICLSSAGKYLTTDGSATPECHAEAAQVLAQVFDRVPLGIEVRALVDVVVRWLPDVILMPPTPRAVRLDAAMAAGGPLLEVTRQENGKTVEEVQL